MKNMKVLGVFLALSLVVGAFAFSASAFDPPEFFMIVARGTPDEVRAAIAAGADVNELYTFNDEFTDIEMTPLFAAVGENASLETVKILLEAGADVNFKISVGAAGLINNTVLMTASGFNRNPEVIVALIEAGADMNVVTTNTHTGRTARALDIARENRHLRNTEALRLLEELTEE